MATLVTLTLAEESALATKYPDVALDAATHLVLAELVARDSEARLQELATKYRALPPDKQTEVAAVLKRWSEGQMESTK